MLARRCRVKFWKKLFHAANIFTIFQFITSKFLVICICEKFRMKNIFQSPRYFSKYLDTLPDSERQKKRIRYQQPSLRVSLDHWLNFLSVSCVFVFPQRSRYSNVPNPWMNPVKKPERISGGPRLCVP